MSRTKRKGNPKLKAIMVKNLLEGFDRGYAKRYVRGDDGAILKDKCGSAKIDDEGGWKLDTWDESPNKHNDVHKRRRLADKKLIKRQLEDS